MIFQPEGAFRRTVPSVLPARLFTTSTFTVTVLRRCAQRESPRCDGLMVTPIAGNTARTRMSWPYGRLASRASRDGGTRLAHHQSRSGRRRRAHPERGHGRPDSTRTDIRASWMDWREKYGRVSSASSGTATLNVWTTGAFGDASRRKSASGRISSSLHASNEQANGRTHRPRAAIGERGAHFEGLTWHDRRHFRRTGAERPRRLWRPGRLRRR